MVSFQNFVGFLVMAVQGIVPNLYRDLSDKIRREAYVTNEIIIRTELLKAKGKLFMDNTHDCTETISNNWTETESTCPLRSRSNIVTNIGDITDGRIVTP